MRPASFYFRAILPIPNGCQLIRRGQFKQCRKDFGRCLLFVSAALLLLSMPVYGLQQEIHVVGDRSFNPYEFCTFFGNKAQGILVDQWRLMAKRNHVHVTYTCDDWQMAQDAVAMGKADAIGGMIRSEEREKRFLYVKKLVRNPPEYLYYSVAYPQEPTLASLAQAKVPVGLTNGDYAEEWFRHNHPDLQLHLYKTYLDVVKAASSGEIRVFAMEESVASHHLNDLGITQLFTRSGIPLFHEWLWAAVRKENTLLGSELQQAFANVSDDELARIELSWSNPRGFWTQAEDWISPYVQDNPIWFFLTVFLACYVAGIAAVFVAAPYQIYKLSSLVSRLDIEIEAVPVRKFPVRWLFLFPLLETSTCVLDALLRARREVATKNFLERRTVKDRKLLYITPYIVDNERIDVSGARERRKQLASQFRAIFRSQAPCMLIIGEGGAGKTSLAVWIALHALLILDDPHDDEENIFARLTLPIFIESDTEQDLLTIIHGQCKALLEDDLLPLNILRALLSKKRIVVVVDGLSEKGPEFRSKLQVIDPSIPRFPLIVTSRRAEDLLGGVAVTTVRPCKLSKTALAAFLEFKLRDLGIWDKFGEEEFFESCQTLAKIVGNADVSPVFVVLFASSYAVDRGRHVSHIHNVPDLFWEYVNSLNRSVSQDRIADPEVLRSLRILGWNCVKSTYQPLPASLSEIREAIKKHSLPENIINYLEQTLGIIEVERPAQTHLRFVLDPVAEYFAASYLFQEGLGKRDTWERLASFIGKDTEAAQRCGGFCRALIDVHESLARTTVLPEFVQEKIAAISGKMVPEPV